uniref:Uncharacterized protein n=1 Tax=Kalanchoe fedtschenkoi TaxID=63787 RepID=A0A7N0SZX0_KALFE
MMVMHKLGMCIELVRLAIDFVIVFAQAVELVVSENSSSALSTRSTNPSYTVSSPPVGIL